VALWVLICGPATANDGLHTLWDSVDSLSKAGNQDSAMALGLECVRLAESSQLDDSTKGAWFIGLGQISNGLRKFSQADSLFRRAVELWGSLFPDSHAAMLELFRWHSLALLYTAQYAEAEAMLKRSLAGWEQATEQDTSYAVNMLSRIGVICMNQQRIDDAQTAYERADALNKVASQPRIQHVRMLKINLSNLYRAQNRFGEAEQMLLSLITVLESADSVNVAYLSAAYHNLAELYSELERYEESEAWFDKAIELESSEHGSDSYPVAMALTSLGNVLMLQGKLDQAGEVYQRALKIKTELAGTTDRSVANTLIKYSQLEREQGNTERALQLAAESFEIRRAGFVNNYWVLAEGNAITYSQVMRGSANVFFAAFADRTTWDTSYVRTAANIILSTKGQVTDCMFERRQSLSVSDDSAQSVLMDRYKSMAKAISGLYFKGPGSGNPDEYRRRMDSLMRESRELESQLATRGADFQTTRDMHDVHFDRIQSLLPDNAVLIEYIEFENPKLGDSDVSRNYFALVLCPDTDPVVRNLGSSERIDSVVVEYRRNYDAVSESWPGISEEQIEHSRAIHKKLHSHLIAPIEEYLHDKEMVLIAPDGALNLVAFGGLQSLSGDYLIEKYALHYLAAGRDLARFHDSQPSGIGLLAFGGIDFESGSVDTEQASREIEAGVMHSGESGESEVTLYAGPAVRSGLAPLPYTRREVSQVAKIWEHTRNEPTVVVTGREATEERFKQEAPGKRVIHCATHGFFGGQQLRDALGEGLATNSGSGLDNPLVKSGLFFAGVIDRATADEDGGDDGFLTALEVANINLKGVEWVVLSACGSGLGEVQRGEGVYGLRRAFLMAGARTVISALWSVPDKQSQSMMEQLYVNGEANLAYAMQQMAVKEITDLRSRGLPTHPFSWAAFVAVGDWRVR
jgi:CHAT domain-containing protein/tetratricopeptide (TPR) repeat protein